MNSLERGLFFLATFLAPLSALRVGGVNLTAFDLAVACLFLVQVVRRGSVPDLGAVYWSGGILIAGGCISALTALQVVPAAGQIAQWFFIVFVVIPAVYLAAREMTTAVPLLLGLGLAVGFLGAHAAWELSSGRAEFMGARYVGFLGDSQVLAFTASSVICYCLFAVSTLRDAPARYRVLAGILTSMSFATLVWLLLLTASRTGALASGAAVATALWLAFRFQRRRGVRAGPGRIAMVVSMAVLVGVAVFRLADEQLVEFMRYRMSSSLDASSSTVFGRTRVYTEAVQMIGAGTLVHGVGLENYPLHSVYAQKPHNVPLLFLVEGGALFLAGFLLLVAVFFRQLVKWRTRWWPLDPAHALLAAAAAGGFVAFLVIAMLNTQSIGRLYWFNYALLLGFLSDRSRETTS